MSHWLIRSTMSCRRAARKRTDQALGDVDMISWRVAGLIAALFVMNLSAFSQLNRDSRVIIWPKPNYPQLALWFGWEAYCEVRFAVDEEGHPFAVAPNCSRRIFCFDAKRAVSAAEFSPKLVNGVPTVRPNVIFPLIYSIEGSDYDRTQDDRPLEPCEEKAVA